MASPLTDLRTVGEVVLAPRSLFLLASTLLAVILGWLGYAGVLPLSIEYFVFYSILVFLFALWRPSLAFLLLLALLPLEIVTLTPPEWGVALRPYQWVALLLGLALGVQWLSRRIHWPLFHWNHLDTLLSLLVGVIGLAGIISQGVAVKQSIVLASFLYLYFLGRIFLRTRESVRVALPFFLIPALMSLLWGVLQNVLFLSGQASWAVMPGRPNGTLPEPDWLGLFAVFALIPLLAWLVKRIEEKESWRAYVTPFLGLGFVWLVLILTVSRSAWLAGGTAVAVFFAIVCINRVERSFDYAKAFLLARLIVVAFGLALIIVEAVPLSRFVLLERAASTASQFQTITIACREKVAIPEEIQHVDELAQYGCEHISLEEKTLRAERGEWVVTTERPDPNIDIRKMIYVKSWEVIQANPVLGIGLGNIGPILGVDERGASYNASNLFLEITLAGGVLALLVAVALMVVLIWYGLREWRHSRDPLLLTSLLALLVGFLIFNGFNTGLLLGFVWIWLALFSVIWKENTHPSETAL